VNGERAEPRTDVARGSREACCAAVLLLAIPLSAAPRYLFSTSMSASLLLAALALAGLLALLWPLLGSPKGAWRTFLPFATVLASVSALVLFWLSAPDFHGLPAESGGDAGNHVRLSHGFEAFDTKAYEGMSGYYALDYWLRASGLGDDLVSTRAAWQLAVVACVLAMLTAGWLGLRSLSAWRERGVLVAACVLLTPVPAAAIALTLVHYYQAQGFTVHVFGLIPLALGGVLYSIARARTLRLVVLVGTIVTCRFTYVLNAGDVMLAAATAFLVESRGLERKARWALRIAALGFFAVGVLAYVRIGGLFSMGGGFRSAPLVPQLLGLGGLTLVFAGLGPLGRYFGAPLAPELRRFASVLAILSGLPAALVTAWLLLDGRVTYYPQKYGFNAIVLGSLCAVPMVFASAIGLVRRGGTPMAGVAASALVLASAAALAGLAASSSQYAKSFHERVMGPPYDVLTPHAERPVWRFIESRLERERSRFGGFLTPRWPESMFTNAHFDFKGYIDAFRGKVVDEPGYCVFWYDNAKLPQSLRDGWSAESAARVRRLSASTQRKCESFSARGNRYAVCSRCFRSRTRALPLAAWGQGFHGVERDSAGKEFRWTDGDAHVPLLLSNEESSARCAVSVDATGERPYEIWLGSQRLGGGPRQLLPTLEPSGSQDLRIRSETFVPKSTGTSNDARALGVAVRGISLECSDEPRATGAIRILSATFGGSCGAERGNRTGAVSAQCDGKTQCQFAVNQDFGDPAPNCAKDFSVKYRCGAHETVMIAEHGATSGENYTLLLDCE
jgi:hypothetical protein